jgi:hypothetical protein
MSALSAPINESSPDSAPPGWRRRFPAWERLFLRCARTECPHAGRFWIGVSRRRAGKYLGDRWYCSPECLERAVQSSLSRMLAEARPAKPRTHRLPLGLLLVSRRLINEEQLKQALRLQREGGRGRLGEWLQQIAALSGEELTTALGLQWGCPVFPLADHPGYLRWGSLLPYALLESSRMVPVHYDADSRLLHLAFAERLDHIALYAVEQMLGCRTTPCVADESAVAEALDELGRAGRSEEACFESMTDPEEISRTTCSYASVLGAARITLARSSAHIWVRFFRDGATRDLLFQISGSRPAPRSKVSVQGLKKNEKQPIKR